MEFKQVETIGICECHGFPSCPSCESEQYKKNHPKPIPIGVQEFNYQKEDVFFDFTKMHEKLLIDAYKPSRNGKEPYPNQESEVIEKYELELKREYNGINIVLKKIFTTGEVGIYTTFVSFSEFVNRVFEGHSASSWISESQSQNP